MRTAPEKLQGPLTRPEQAGPAPQANLVVGIRVAGVALALAGAGREW
jgi:hypothetical protein